MVINLKRLGALRKALEMMYIDTCTIYTKERQRDPVTGEVTFAEVASATGVPCRLSYDTMRFKSNVNQNFVPEGISNTTLFLGLQVDVPAGCKITVVRDGHSLDFAYSGFSKLHEHHQEISLREWNGWV